MSTAPLKYIPHLNSMRALSACKIFLTFLLLFPSEIVLATQFHYFVLKEDVTEAVSVVSHQVIDANYEPEEPESSQPSASRLENRIEVFINKKTTGSTIFRTYAYSSPWLRGEFHGENGIDGKIFPQNDKFYVVKLPVEDGTIMRVTPSIRAETNSQPINFFSRKSSNLEVDLDTLQQGKPPLNPNALPAGYYSGNIYSNGASTNRLDLLIVSEGYTASEQNLFISQATSLANSMLSISPYSDFKHLINVSWLFVPSNQSGADKPSCPETPGSAIIAVDTAFDGTFCTNGHRRLVTVNQSKVFTAAASVPDWDKILVLVNDSEYGGAGGSIGVATTNTSSAEVIQHEFGHMFTLLADEYESAYTGFPSCSDLAGTSPCEVNVTNQTQRDLIKWRGWINAATTIPTTGPLADPIAAGLWQGARYFSSGMYRQCYNGIMRSLGRPFCHVDSEAFVSRLYAGWGGSPSQGISLIENTVPSNNQVTSPLQSDVQFQGTLVGSATAPGLAYDWLVNGVVQNSGTGIHGNQVTFSYRVANAGPNAVELRVTDRTPLKLSPPSRSHTWTVTGYSGSSYSLSVSKVGAGTVSSSPAGISCGSTCSANFSNGTSVTLTATPDSGSSFTGWSGACTGTSTCTVSMSAARAVAATFTAKPLITALSLSNLAGVQANSNLANVLRYQVTVPAGAANLTISISGGTGDADLYVRKDSQPNYTNWHCASASSGNIDNCSVNFPEPRNLPSPPGVYHIMLNGYFAFSGVTLTVTYNSDPTVSVVKVGNGTITSSPGGISCGTSCSGTFPANTTVTLTATPGAGSRFGGWSGGLCTGTAPTCAFTLTNNRTETATFRGANITPILQLLLD